MGIVVIKYPSGLYLLDVSRGLMYGRKVNHYYFVVAEDSRNEKIVKVSDLF